MRFKYAFLRPPTFHATLAGYSERISFFFYIERAASTNEGIGGRSGEALKWMEEEYVEESGGNRGTKRRDR